MTTPESNSDQVHADLVCHIDLLQKDIKNIRRDLVKTIAVSMVTIMIVLGLSIWYAGHVRSVGDGRWCTLMVSLDNRQQNLKNQPGVTKDQREFIDNIHNLRNQLGCK